MAKTGLRVCICRIFVQNLRTGPSSELFGCSATVLVVWVYGPVLFKAVVSGGLRLRLHKVTQEGMNWRAKYSSCYFLYCTCDQCFKHKDGTRVVFGRLRSLDTKGLVFGWGKGVSALTGLSKGLFDSRYWKHTSLSCSAEDTYNRATVPASGLHYSHDIILEKEVLDLKVSLGEAGLRLATDSTAHRV